jgi:CRISPR system Cascade subunit CasC
MNSKNFLNFHVLMSHSPSCLNRDDMNMQKSAVFGGVNRVRISSQSLKRAIRTSEYYKQHLGAPSVRTRDLGKLKARFTAELGGRFDAAVINQAIEWIAFDEGAATDDNEASAVAPWSVEEVAYFCQFIQSGQDEGADPKKLKKQIEKDARPFREALSRAVDIALSGRMATSGLMTSLSMDGALSVAHVLTTHAVEPQDVDWFTAVDDLTQDAGETGAGHLNTQQFSAGVFYRYASLNLKQLQVNLGLIPAMDNPETPESRQRALDIGRHVFHLLATVVPSAKQQSFAAHNLADFALVSFSDLPVSLANAFEKPVKPQRRDEGFLDPSVQALADYWATLNTFHSLNENAVAASSRNFANPSLTRLPSLQAMEQWIAADGVQG